MSKTDKPPAKEIKDSVESSTEISPEKSITTPEKSITTPEKKNRKQRGASRGITFRSSGTSSSGKAANKCFRRYVSLAKWTLQSFA